MGSGTGAMCLQPLSILVLAIATKAVDHLTTDCLFIIQFIIVQRVRVNPKIKPVILSGISAFIGHYNERYW